MARRAKPFPGPKNTQGFVNVAKGIYTYVGGGGSTNFGLVLTDKNPVVIDNDIRVRAPFVSGMRKITRKKPGLLFNTHHNFDHTSDNEYYHRLGAISFGCDVIREEMEREENAGVWVKQMLGRGPRVEHLVGRLRASPPQVTFDDILTIRYGGRIFQLIYISHCHTKGDSVVWMPEERIMFTGDLLNYRTFPTARLGVFENWIPALEFLKKFPVRQTIPGHGPIPPRGTGGLEEMRKHLLTLRSRTAAALRKAKTAAKAAELVKMDEYRNWFRTRNEYPNALKMGKELQRKRRKPRNRS